MGQLDGLPGWGATLKLTGATEVVTATQVNNRAVLKVGRPSGGQTVSIPGTTDVITNARLVIIGDDGALSGGNAVTVTDGVYSTTIDAFEEIREIMWTGSAWVPVDGSSATVAWGDVTGKPNVVTFDDAADGTVPNGSGAGTGAWTATPKISTLRLANSVREITVPAQTRIRSVGNALESYDTARFQASISPVTSYSGNDQRASTGVREYVHAYQTAAAAVQVIDFDLTYVAADYLLTTQRMMAKFKAEIIGNVYAGGGGQSQTSTYETNGYVARDPVTGRTIVEDTSALSFLIGDDAAWTFAWTYPADATLRLTATPNTANNASLGVLLRVFATYGYGPQSGT